MDVSNGAIAEILHEIGEYLAMENVPFKPRAFEKAAEAISNSEEEIAGLYKKGGVKELQTIPGIGVSIAQKIEEFLKTGKIKDHEELKKKAPVRLNELGKVEGLGPKSIKKLYEELGVRNIADLEKAAKAGKIAKLEGFGKKSEEKILKGIGFAADSGKRFILGYTMPRIRSVEEYIKRISGVERVVVAGSARRRKETIGDVDILVVSEKPKLVMDDFVAMPDVVNVIAHGNTKSSVKIKTGLNIDLRVVKKESYGAALNYFTGSKDHNVSLRQVAIGHGWKLNEYGLFKGTKQIAGANEEDLYKMFGMDYIEPELRENTGEIEAARAHRLPKIIGYGDVRGDLQIQTDWTDGTASIEAMANAAIARGLEYIVITDHTKRLAMMHGLDEKEVLKQMVEIDKVNLKLKTKNLKLTVLKGTECDILKDGSLDLPDPILEKLDVVGVSVHSHFNLGRREQTERVTKAISNPHVDILFHPTGRIINRRPAIDLDIDEIIGVAKKTGTVMEINSFPERSDLKDEYIRKCVEAGVKLSIDSDAHAPIHFEYLEYGISQARRGWATRGDVINAWPLEKMLSFLKKQ